MEIIKEKISRINLDEEEKARINNAILTLKQLDKLVRNINSKDNSLGKAIPTLTQISKGEYKIYE